MFVGCGFGFLRCYATTQLALQLHQERIQVVRSPKLVRRIPTESNGTPRLFCLFLKAATQLARQIHQERTQVVCSNKVGRSRLAWRHSRNGPRTYEYWFDVCIRILFRSRHSHTQTYKQTRNRTKHKCFIIDWVWICKYCFGQAWLLCGLLLQFILILVMFLFIHCLCQGVINLMCDFDISWFILSMCITIISYFDCKNQRIRIWGGVWWHQ